MWSQLNSRHHHSRVRRRPRQPVESHQPHSETTAQRSLSPAIRFLDGLGQARSILVSSQTGAPQQLRIRRILR